MVQPRHGEYTPIQISFDLGSPIHREAMFQVLLTLEQEEPEPDYAEKEGCDGTCEQELYAEAPDNDYRGGEPLDPSDGPFSFGTTPEVAPDTLDQAEAAWETEQGFAGSAPQDPNG